MGILDSQSYGSERKIIELGGLMVGEEIILGLGATVCKLTVGTSRQPDQIPVYISQYDPSLAEPGSTPWTSVGEGQYVLRGSKRTVMTSDSGGQVFRPHKGAMLVNSELWLDDPDDAALALLGGRIITRMLYEPYLDLASA